MWVHLLDDAQCHCGGGANCIAGVCAAPCAPGQTRCGGLCRSLRTDPTHCGACGNACTVGQVCVHGACLSACPTGQTDCAGSCRDLRRDNGHCGACGRSCGPGTTCSAGVCVVTCGAGQTVCDGACRDLASDRAHCGACGNACPARPHASPTCAAGLCGVRCDAGFADCNGDASDGCEVDLGGSAAHCRACGNACDPGGVCVAGQCRNHSRIAAGLRHTCVARLDGRVSCWGDNAEGQLGDGTGVRRTTPTLVPGIAGALGVVAGQLHTCALLADGTVRCWGYGYGGMLGHNASEIRTTPVQVVVANGSPLTGVTQIAAGSFNTCALRADSTVWCWGHNQFGTLGDGTTGGIRPFAAPIMGLSDVVQVDVAFVNACALRRDGAVFCWGQDSWGQLGNGDRGSTPLPDQVVGLTDAVHISAAKDHTCAVLRDGSARCWGANAHGQLGNGATTVSLVPVPVSGLTDAAFISAGAEQLVFVANTCVVRRDRTVSCWGAGYNGQVGDGTSGATRTAPTPVVTTTGLTAALQVSTSGLHACALTRDGAVFCWGYGANGQIGDGATVDRNAPVLVLGP